MLTVKQKRKVFALAVFAALSDSGIEDSDLVEDAGVPELNLDEARSFIETMEPRARTVAAETWTYWETSSGVY